MHKPQYDASGYINHRLIDNSSWEVGLEIDLVILFVTQVRVMVAISPHECKPNAEGASCEFGHQKQ